MSRAYVTAAFLGVLSAGIAVAAESLLFGSGADSNWRAQPARYSTSVIHRPDGAVCTYRTGSSPQAWSCR